MENVHDPKVWGPPFWRVYDIIVTTYPHRPSHKERNAVRSFFESQKYLIPCRKCVKGYRSIIRRYPPQVESRDKLTKWLKLVKEETRKHVEKQSEKHT